jgi:hypothetical protein
MYKRVQIHNVNKLVRLRAGRYRIYMLGGYSVKLGLFDIMFKNVDSNVVFTCKKAFWRIQTHFFGIRARRIFVIDLPIDGQYELIFNDPHSVVVQKSNLFMFSFFFKPLNNEELEVLITDKLWD